MADQSKCSNTEPMTQLEDDGSITDQYPRSDATSPFSTESLTSDSSSVIFDGAFARRFAPAVPPNSPTNSIIYMGESALTPIPLPLVRANAAVASLTQETQLPLSGDLHDPVTSVAVDHTHPLTGSLNIFIAPETQALPKFVQEQWAIDQAGEEADSDPSQCLVYDLGSANIAGGAARAEQLCCGHIPLMCKCNSIGATGDSQARPDGRSTSPYSSADEIVYQETVGGVNNGIQQSGDAAEAQTMVYDLAMPAPAQWDEPVPNLCCGRVPYICRCDAQGTSDGTTSRAPVRRQPTPYPKPGEAEHLAAFSTMRFAHEAEGGGNKENDEPASGRSTPLGEVMDWYDEGDVCATPEVEYTPATSPWEGRPPKRRLLELKPSLVGEVQPTTPSFPSPSPPQSATNAAGFQPAVDSGVQPRPFTTVAAAIQPSAAAEVEPQLSAGCTDARQSGDTDVLRGVGCFVTPISGSCDGFRVLFKNGGQVILTGIVLVGATLSIIPVGHQMLRLRFAKFVDGQNMPEQYFGVGSEVEPQEHHPAPKVSSLTNLRLELAPECYVIIGSITLKGASFATYQDEDGSVVVELDGF